MNINSSIFTSGGATSENTTLCVHECNKNLSYTESNFLFLLCFTIAKIKFIPMRQQSRQRNSFLYSRFTSNLMLSACLLGLKFATENNLKFLFAKQIKKSDKKECLTSRAIIM